MNLEWKTIKVDKAFGTYEYLFEVLVNEKNEVVFAQLVEIPPIRGDYKRFILGYGIINIEIDLPDELDMNKIPAGSYVSYSCYMNESMTENNLLKNYYNEKVVAYNEIGEVIHSQEFLSENCDHVTEMGAEQIYNMNSLKKLIGKKFEDVQIMVNDLFYNDTQNITKEGSNKSR